MPNYRLTHKFTGVTVPATAGYYGADNQSETVWKQAGAAMYMWKSATLANTYFLGATPLVDASAKFTATTISGTWTGTNGGTGTPAYAERTLGEAWENAEKAVFDALVAFLGNTADVDSFRGYMPVNADGTIHKVNVWMINSGDSAGAYGIDRTYGESPLWCNEVVNADLTGVFENRSTAMYFAGAVKTWLKQTNNYSETGIVTFCRLRDLPQPPEELIILNNRYWRIRMPLEICFLTEDTY